MENEWKIILSRVEPMEYPMRYFEFDFADEASRKSYLKYWASKMFPKGSLLEDLEDIPRLTTDKIRDGVKAIAYLTQYKEEAIKHIFQMVVICENFEERASESKIRCLEPRNQKTVNVSLNCLFPLNIEKHFELTGLQDFEYMTELRRLTLIENEFEKILTVKCPIWKGTHFSVCLWSKRMEISVNDKLKYILTHPQICKIPQISEKGPDGLKIPLTLCAIKSEIGSWIPEVPSKVHKNPSTMHFHVSKTISFGEKPGLVIHPVKYWKAFKKMEKDMQNYGKKNLSTLYSNFEDRGSFLLAGREEEEEDGKIIMKFYRGFHTGEVSIAGGTHRIAFVDYAIFVWVENGNMMPLIPEFCNLPMMGGKCEWLIEEECPARKLRKVLELYRQHVAGIVEKIVYFQDIFPIFTMRNLRAIPQPGR